MAESARDRLRAAADADAVLRLKGDLLGKQRGELRALEARLREVPKEDRPRAGQAFNEAKQEIEALLGARLDEIERARRRAALEPLPADVTLPGRRPGNGTLHPLTQTRTDLEAVFVRLGFDVCDGPEVELDWYNFEALGLPPYHPARDAQDTFFVEGPHGAGRDGGLLLRTHTSPVQIRTMLAAGRPPVRMVCPGAVYRRDDDPTHSPMFMQIEGLCVGEGVTFAHLKWVLGEFARQIFGAGTRTRFRPSFFPFTEPSAEVDVTCVFCGGSGTRDGARCAVCKETGWLEILGCGMVDPVVLGHVGYDAERWTGYAFGMGIDRIAMLRYGINDIRLLYENDLRFLGQFR
ncbi:MAG TPA: phenylalanine--tRNA ligase subunit alpha [Myxococcota bacterium]|nr:phenylalanine--tRNA ligase subunit alpha [Myxococcota bacterium]